MGDGGRLTIMGPPSCGLPYGPIARAILEWLITNAHSGKQRHPIDLGYDPRDLMGVMGFARSPTASEEGTILEFIDQFKRLSRLRFSFAGAANGFASLMNMSIVLGADFQWRPFESKWTGRPHSKIILDQMFIDGAVHLLEQGRQAGMLIEH